MFQFDKYICNSTLLLTMFLDPNFGFKSFPLAGREPVKSLALNHLRINSIGGEALAAKNKFSETFVQSNFNQKQHRRRRS